MSCLILRIFILIKGGVISMAQDIISTIGDLVKWIIDTVNKFTKK
ncbi:TPA: delta-lysin family phenol-soluble modulin [Staphylococcus aureus]|nr:delta-lysin family phenol-soluble modulin [Staphylococcus aureus]MBW1240764.1 delta-lysin family phenol-soluble modulin [Staphylococcus aureus]MBW1306711.1 delta-lysin family phenol-soluble modulin [Staphylococcus aureus]MBW1311439.1 delta-lysin family phenol-soluble modulin [Staphylococcus aureus]HCU7004035.1 delta-lysin family phenol-soluble modulin [Staphylococcus aureus]HCV2855752.1 delta-lysin family phenol-soluble modulin [Staphylococcus aureus]